MSIMSVVNQLRGALGQGVYWIEFIRDKEGCSYFYKSIDFSDFTFFEDSYNSLCLKFQGGLFKLFPRINITDDQIKLWASYEEKRKKSKKKWELVEIPKICIRLRKAKIVGELRPKKAEFFYDQELVDNIMTIINEGNHYLSFLMKSQSFYNGNIIDSNDLKFFDEDSQFCFYCYGVAFTISPKTKIYDDRIEIWTYWKENQIQKKRLGGYDYEVIVEKLCLVLMKS